MYPLLATDIIIEYNDGNKEGIVLIKRKNPPYGIAIPGGIQEYGLSLEENAKKEAKEETNLEIMLQKEKPLCINSNPDRDPRGHIISVTYVANGFGKLKAGDDAAEAGVYNIDEVKKLIEKDMLQFDHAKILEKYLEFKKYQK